jgi:hypothetical protein
MKTNITTENYEAYLLDYMEGNLGPEGAAALQAFIATQGLNWAELTEELPHLEAPEVSYEGKEKLKKQRVVVPLYFKIASAAAVGGMLLTIGLWPEKSLPKVEPVAELKPIEAHLTITDEPFRIVPKQTVQYTERQETKKEAKSEPTRTEIESIASLASVKAQEIATSEDAGFALMADIELLRYRLETEQALAQLAIEPSYEEEMPTSWIGKGIYRMTEGRHSSIIGLINTGLHLAKKEVVKATTDMAAVAYYRADEHLEEARERWQEKHGE